MQEGKIPEREQMLAIKGIGVITVAEFLVEVGDVRRFESPRQYKRGRAELLQKNWKTILYLLDEAQFVDADTPPKLVLRMEELAKKKPDHPAVKAYQRYRGGPDETIRSVIMTVNARMQPFDNEELLEIFSSNDIPLDEFGTGIDGDKKTKSNLFIIIPDDDDTFNFVPGMVYTLLFQELYRQARFFGGKLPMDVGFWLDEMAKKIHSTPNDKKRHAGEPTITVGMIQSALHAEKEREEAERKAWFVENFDLLQAEAPEEVIKSIIRPEIEEGQVLQKKKMWLEMEGIEAIEE